MLLEVIIKPNSKMVGFFPQKDGSVVVCVKEPPIENKANLAVIAIVAKSLGKPKSSIEIVRGGKSRKKFLRILD